MKYFYLFLPDLEPGLATLSAVSRSQSVLADMTLTAFLSVETSLIATFSHRFISGKNTSTEDPTTNAVRGQFNVLEYKGLSWS